MTKSMDKEDGLKLSLAAEQAASAERGLEAVRRLQALRDLLAKQSYVFTEDAMYMQVHRQVAALDDHIKRLLGTVALRLATSIPAGDHAQQHWNEVVTKAVLESIDAKQAPRVTAVVSCPLERGNP